MPAGSTAFSSLEPKPHNNEGINGSLTPARPHRRPQQQQSYSSAQKYTNDHDSRGTRAGNTSYAHLHATPSNPRERSPLRQGREHGSDRPFSVAAAVGKLAAGGEGISLQETEARIEELERSEFDLKMRLHYTEERLEEAVEGSDALQLHREIAHAKRLRAKAEETAREVSAALSATESNCLVLETQVREIEAKGKAEREERAAAERTNEKRLKNHLRLLEGTLRAERAENARMRIAASGRRDSWDDAHDGDGQGHLSARRRSTGESEGGQREHQQQLVAKVRSQDSSLRSLRADVTALRRRLRAQAETLARQKEDNDVVRRAAEQVACLEAEEIARLAADLEQAVRTADAEAQRRREAEDRLAAAERRLASWKGSSNPDNGAADGRSPRVRSRSPPQSPRESAGGRRRAAEAAEDVARKSGVPEGRAYAGRRAAAQAWGEEGSEDGSPEREKTSLQSPTRATGSTIASRGRRCVPDRVARQKGDSVGKERSSVSPRGSKRRPGSSSPSPSHRRGGGSSALSASDQNTAGILSRDAEPDYGHGAASGSSSRRCSNGNGTRTAAEEHGTFERCDPRRGRRVIESAKSPPRESRESPGGGGRRRPSVGRREASGRSRRPSTEPKNGACNGGDLRRGPGRASPIVAETAATTAESDPNPEGRRERRTGVVRHGKEDGSVRFDGGEVGDDEGARKGTTGGRDREGSTAETTPGASVSGQELAATVARELRLAVATTTSPASPASVAGFPAVSAGENTPSDYSTGNRQQTGGGGEQRGEKPGSRRREDPMLLPRRKDSGKNADRIRTPPGKSRDQSGDCGQSSKSREVAELESDVQHIFQFFSAARGLKTGQDDSSYRSGEEKGAGIREGSGESVEDYGTAIAKALALWGGTGEAGSGR